ncbi:Outer membrane protein transport protein (OMPP1/FadL/TodX) [Nonlabens sp. Hel1_33_55]|uniref:OmpP1/FadL family transporter n=1 Tax=Nonlabens sp. Hel1_33_55 TaxID=1336802 RepID=UPI000875B90E|nr:outer membrane protein transport protein [Nonlabens sp. Hel1_33_55]SCX87783.1 Outer membrane protein transport protein (OMPP1/FadL/TodX) [Nonlabens sp. Hel1_33_55]
MKNYIIILSALLTGALFCEAQTVNDGLLYGQQDDLYGTARYRALSGAFGALGGDLTAMGQNPAGSAIFSNHYASFSLGYTKENNTGNYFGSGIDSDDSDFNFNQFGGVLVFKSTQDNLLSKFAVGLNYDTTRLYDDNTIFAGTSDTSVSQYFLNNANGFTLDNFTVMNGETISGLYQFLGEQVGFDAQQGFLGYESFVIDAVDNNDPNNVQYISNTGTGTFTQSNQIQSSGTQGKTSFNIAGQFADKWSIGLNLNGHFIDYSRFTSFREVNSNADAITTDVQLDNRLDVEGTGFSFQLGAIGNLTESLRIGATYESPTWYNIDETLTQEIFTTRIENGTFEPANVRPNVINIYPTYDLRSPGSLTGSIAYIFGTSGLISFDYSTKDYSQLEFEPNVDQNFDNNNAFINENLQRANTIRLGGEYRVDRLTLRGGYRMVESPYEDKSIADDLTGFSLGLGYNWGNTTLDLSYDYSERSYSQQLFETGLTNRGLISNETNNVILSLGFNF